MHALLLLVSLVKGPYLQNVSKTAITVMWQTDVAAAGTVRARPMSGSASDEVSASSPSALFHKVRLSGLAPSTAYQYTVDAGGAQASGSFSTAPATGDEAFTFIVYGDNKFGVGSSWCSGAAARVRDRLLAEVPDFILHTGDMVDDGDEPHYRTFFDCYRALLRENVLVPVIGNHEYAAGTASDPLGNYRHYFDYPRSGTETWYAFTYGSTRILAFDATPGIHAPESWLDDQLAAADADPQIRHVFVAFHAPPYSTCTSLAPAGGDTWEMTLTERHIENHAAGGKLRAVLNGHVHNYEHLVHRGVDYVVTGGGGSQLCGAQASGTPSNALSRAFSNAYHYLRVHVAGDYVRFEAVGLDGMLIDSFAHGNPPEPPPPTSLDAGSGSDGAPGPGSPDGGPAGAPAAGEMDGGCQSLPFRAGGAAAGGVLALGLVLAFGARRRRD